MTKVTSSEQSVPQKQPAASTKSGEASVKHTIDAAKATALKAAVTEIEKQYGAGSIMQMGSASRILVETYPSGSLSLDLAIGGGIPKAA